MRHGWKVALRSIIFASGLAALGVGVFVFSGASANQEDARVAYIEEIEILPDGSQRVWRYKPGEKPVPMTIPAPAAAKPRQRELTAIEKLELDQLERDFAHGKISESEYYQRKREIYRSTFINGPPPDDGLFNQATPF